MIQADHRPCSLIAPVLHNVVILYSDIVTAGIHGLDQELGRLCRENRGWGREPEGHESRAVNSRLCTPHPRPRRGRRRS